MCSQENDIFKKIYEFDCGQSIYTVFTRSIVVNTWSGAEPRWTLNHMRLSQASPQPAGVDRLGCRKWVEGNSGCCRWEAGAGSIHCWPGVVGSCCWRWTRWWRWCRRTGGPGSAPCGRVYRRWWRRQWRWQQIWRSRQPPLQSRTPMTMRSNCSSSSICRSSRICSSSTLHQHTAKSNLLESKWWPQ